MKLLSSLSPMLVAACFLPIPGEGKAQQGPVTSYLFTRIYQDSSGASHFADEELPLELVNPGRGIPPTPASAPIPSTGLRVFCPPPGGGAGWHPVPARLYNLVLSGEFEIEVSDGEVRRFGPGSVVLGEDTGGQGHRTRVVGDETACFAMIMLPSG